VAGKKFPRITEAEWQVMKALWAKAPRTSNEVVEALTGRTGWTPSTIKTLLQRLVKKRVVRTEGKIGREFLFIPRLTREECVHSESRSLLRRVFGGATLPMIAGLLQNEQLTREEIASLRQMLEELERKAKP
jgi:BlaI family penicillinase repressor